MMTTCGPRCGLAATCLGGECMGRAVLRSISVLQSRSLDSCQGSGRSTAAGHTHCHTCTHPHRHTSAPPHPHTTPRSGYDRSIPWHGLQAYDGAFDQLLPCPPNVTYCIKVGAAVSVVVATPARICGGVWHTQLARAGTRTPRVPPTAANGRNPCSVYASAHTPGRGAVPF